MEIGVRKSFSMLLEFENAILEFQFRLLTTGYDFGIKN